MWFKMCWSWTYQSYERTYNVFDGCFSLLFPDVRLLKSTCPCLPELWDCQVDFQWGPCKHLVPYRSKIEGDLSERAWGKASERWKMLGDSGDLEKGVWDEASVLGTQGTNLRPQRVKTSSRTQSDGSGWLILSALTTNAAKSHFRCAVEYLPVFTLNVSKPFRSGGGGGILAWPKSLNYQYTNTERLGMSLDTSSVKRYCLRLPNLCMWVWLPLGINLVLNEKQEYKKHSFLTQMTLVELC